MSETDMKEVDFNNPKREDIETLLYRFMRNGNGDEVIAEVLAKALSNFVNAWSRDGAKLLVEESMKDHRTLIQSKMNFAFLMIGRAAKDYKDGNYDGRNEYGFKLAAEIWDALSSGDDGEGGRYHKLSMGVPLI